MKTSRECFDFFSEKRLNSRHKYGIFHTQNNSRPYPFSKIVSSATSADSFTLNSITISVTAKDLQLLYFYTAIISASRDLLLFLWLSKFESPY